MVLFHTCTVPSYVLISLSLSLQDSFLVHEILGTTVEFADRLNTGDNTRELALESYTELLDLLDFMFLPGILRRQAESLMNLVTIVILSYMKSLWSLSILFLIIYLLIDLFVYLFILFE